MELIYDERITNTHVASSASSTLLLVDILMNNINEFLMQILVIMSVLKQNA